MEAELADITLNAANTYSPHAIAGVSMLSGIAGATAGYFEVSKKAQRKTEEYQEEFGNLNRDQLEWVVAVEGLEDYLENDSALNKAHRASDAVLNKDRYGKGSAIRDRIEDISENPEELREEILEP